MTSNREVRNLVKELALKIPELEKHGAFVAAAHLQSSIDALCKQFDLPRDSSGLD